MERYIIFFLIFYVTITNTSNLPTSARVESCSGCSLNRLPEVKKFIFEDIPLYEHVEFKSIQGAEPELVLLDDQDRELERIALSSYNRQQCNDLLKKKGFKKQTNEL